MPNSIVEIQKVKMTEFEREIKILETFLTYSSFKTAITKNPSGVNLNRNTPVAGLAYAFFSSTQKL